VAIGLVTASRHPVSEHPPATPSLLFIKAVGIGALPRSGALQVYHLIPSPLLSGGDGHRRHRMALRQDAEILAVRIAGGFATPLLLSTGKPELELFPTCSADLGCWC
jgi:hypothetical protein